MTAPMTYARFCTLWAHPVADAQRNWCPTARHWQHGVFHLVRNSPRHQASFAVPEQFVRHALAPYAGLASFQVMTGPCIQDGLVKVSVVLLTQDTKSLPATPDGYPSESR